MIFIIGIGIIVTGGAIALTAFTVRDWLRGGNEWPITTGLVAMIAVAGLLVGAAATADAPPTPGCYRIFDTSGSGVGFTSGGQTVIVSYGGRNYEPIPCPR